MRNTMSYSAEKTYPAQYLDTCSICDEEFSDEGELAEHLIEHTYEEPYKTYIAEVEKKAKVGPKVISQPMQSTLKRNYIPNQRPKSPEVLTISDESDDETSKSKAPKLSNNSNLSKPSASANAQAVKMPASARAQSSKSPSPLVAQPAKSATPASVQPSKPPGNGATLTCQTCQMVFTDAKLHKEHLLTHDKPKPHVCHICKKGFAYKGTLRQHLHLHVSEKLYECEICKLKFSIKRIFKQHMETHGAEGQKILEKYKD